MVLAPLFHNQCLKGFWKFLMENVCGMQSRETFLIFVFTCVVSGLLAFCYIHFMWVIPSRHLLAGLHQVTSSCPEISKCCPSQLCACKTVLQCKFIPWISTALIHCVPIVCITYRWIICHLTFSCGHWVWVAIAMISFLLLFPQSVVMAAAVRAHRLDSISLYPYLCLMVYYKL